ncbi:MAG: type II toxin-antitoxin system HicB family antitoxin [Desulfomonilia bacterium]
MCLANGRYFDQSPIRGKQFIPPSATMCTSTAIGGYIIIVPSTDMQRTTTTIIDSLPNKKLKTPINIIIEPDDEGFFASSPDIPSLYGCGDTRIEAVEMLRREIESLYEDLMGDDQFTDDWDDIKKLLINKIIL